MEHARKRTHSRNLLVASLQHGCNAVRRGCRLHKAPPPHCNLCCCSLAVLLLDPRGDVEAPRVGHEERAENVEAVH